MGMQAPTFSLENEYDVAPSLNNQMAIVSKIVTISSNKQAFMALLQRCTQRKKRKTNLMIIPAPTKSLLSETPTTSFD
jgi:hypothetical protein